MTVRFARLLPALLLLYGCASLLHFAHNAEFVMAYPNLPSWITRSTVYLVWLGITALGGLGYLIFRFRHRGLGICLLALYAALGLDGLLHYTRAPVMAHTRAMNFTIWFEVAAAMAVLIALAATAAAHFARGRAGESS